jgi:hypothetical protein
LSALLLLVGIVALVRYAQRQAQKSAEARELELETREIEKIRRGQSKLSNPSARLLARVAADEELRSTITDVEFFMYHSLTEEHFVLRDFPNLKGLSFYDCSGVDALVRHLDNKESIEDFGDWLTDLQATDAELLSTFPNLKKLSRQGHPVDIEALRAGRE